MMYADSNDSWLPPFKDAPTSGLLWCRHISPYLGKSTSYAAGNEYLRCPNGTSLYTYGVNYNYVFDYAPPGYGGSARIDKVPSTTFLAVDTLKNSHIGNPNGWVFTSDSDGDGLNDIGVGTYLNDVSPRHNDGANFLFADGSASWRSIRDFVTNKDNIWGGNVTP